MTTPCQEPGAPSAFPDDWGIGRHGRAKRSQALALCRMCPQTRACAQKALREVDLGLPLYGIRAGIAFTDIDRQDAKVARLRNLVEAAA